MKQLVVALLISGGLFLSACQKEPDQETATADTQVAAAAPAAEIAATSTPAPPPAANIPEAETAPVGSFDTAKAPVSAVKLGSFPYLALPDGYVAGSPQTLDLARFPFWVGDHYVWVEGKIYQSSIEAGSGKQFSKYELQRNIENLITQAGGRKIVEAQLPSGMRSKLDPDARQVDSGLGDIISNPTVTFLIHRADKDIWVHFTASTSRGSWAIVETKAFVPTARLLPN